MSYFSDLGLAEPLLRALETKGYADPTPIQKQAIPALLEGRDLLGIAQTGTGKTAAFSLPSLHRLAADPQPKRSASCRMLVLSPTRELAAQIAENMRGYAKYLNLSVQCVFGGIPVNKQARALVPGCDVLVATPGRLLDLIDQRALTLRNVEIFVLDEADQMMDLGFIVPLKRVSALLPKDRQSLFFSATMPKAIADLGKQFINNPVRVEVTPQATTAERVDQFVTHINQAEKQALLTLSLRRGLAETEGQQKIDRALVFTRTKHGADRVVRHLHTAGVTAAAIHGNKSQAQRTAALNAFRKGDCPILVATDIAARGIDVTGVSHVFNFEMPNVAEQYVHRIGRTARAGADGVAVSYVAPDEKPYLRDIEKLTQVKLMPMALPENFQQEAARLPAPAKRTEPTDPNPRQQRGGGRSGGGRNGGGRGDSARPAGERDDRQHRRGRGAPAPRPEVRRDERTGERRDVRRTATPNTGWSPANFGHEGEGRSERPARDARPQGDARGGERRPQGDRPARAPRPEGNRDGNRQPRPEGNRGGDRRDNRSGGQGGGQRRFGGNRSGGGAPRG
ncbi:DEAD/DEAH box helicase [Novosphingobium sp. MW5]|nr:DEAD/DEAH box helicase [Novosphingobium sp. MW5]